MKMLASASVLGRVDLGSFSCNESDDGSHDVHLGFASSCAPCFFWISFLVSNMEMAEIDGENPC